MQAQTTIITMTGDRPEAFSRCEYYVKRQVIKPASWIVVDDGQVPTVCTMDQTVVRRMRKHNDPMHTLVPNLLAGLEEVRTENVVIFEDDDWYHPHHLWKVQEKLQKVELAGEGKPMYYNVATKHYKEFNDVTLRTSLCATGFKASLIPLIKELCSQDNTPFLDMKLWMQPVSKNVYHPSTDGRYCIGIKGMPGRKGIGIGHTPPKHWEKDQNGNVLRRLIGLDANFYEEIK